MEWEGGCFNTPALFDAHRGPTSDSSVGPIHGRVQRRSQRPWVHIRPRRARSGRWKPAAALGLLCGVGLEARSRSLVWGRSVVVTAHRDHPRPSCSAGEAGKRRRRVGSNGPHPSGGGVCSFRCHHGHPPCVYRAACGKRPDPRVEAKPRYARHNRRCAMGKV